MQINALLDVLAGSDECDCFSASESEGVIYSTLVLYIMFNIEALPMM